jgi:hypothetical protein
MSVLRNVLDRLDREEELDAEVQAAMQAFMDLSSETPREAKDEHGWTPELVAAVRRYTRALTERGEYMLQVARHFEGQVSKYK